jgi:FKBP-type peptidyl-prolyl cis-trans isomerase FklB
MKQMLIVVLFVFMYIIGCSQTNQIDDAKIATKIDSVSYSIGLDIGKNFKRQEIEIEPLVLLKGIQHAMADTSLFTDSDIQKVMTILRQDMREKQMNKMKVVGDKNIEEAGKFFAENKNKEGVFTLPSGLQYKILKSGNGATPMASNKIVAHYSGKLLDGTIFDSSYENGTPLEIGVTEVIKGWTEALQLMKVGDKWELYIPSDLAYGSRGSGPQIGPNAALIFELELLDVK